MTSQENTYFLPAPSVNNPTCPQLYPYMRMFYKACDASDMNDENLEHQILENASQFDCNPNRAIPEYGPMTNSLNGKSFCHQKQPRIGAEFQAVIPSLLTTHNDHKNNNNNNNNNNTNGVVFHDHCIWEPGHVSPAQLSKYLTVFRFVIGTSSKARLSPDIHYDEQKALYLLKLCKYDVQQAIDVLTLRKRIDGDVSTDDEESDNDSSGDNNTEHRMAGMNTASNEHSAAADIYDEIDFCFACNEGGSLVLCDVDGCCKVWHVHCAGMNEVPTAEKWFCPSHSCCVCIANRNTNRVQQQQTPCATVSSIECPSAVHLICSYCANAYCVDHCPKECLAYPLHTIEFLCEDCLDQNSDCMAVGLGSNGSSLEKEQQYRNNAKQRFDRRLGDLYKKKGKTAELPLLCKCESEECKAADMEWFDVYCAIIHRGGLPMMTAEICEWDAVRKQVQVPSENSCDLCSESLRKNYVRFLYLYELMYWPPTSYDPQKRQQMPPSLQVMVDEVSALSMLGSQLTQEKE